MRLTNVNKEVYKADAARMGKNQKIICEFAAMGKPIAEVVEFETKSGICAAMLRNAINSLGISHITAFARKGHVYLLNLLEI